MSWYRIDNRLIHGQVVEGWVPYLETEDLVIINDAVAGNPLRQEIMTLAVPSRISVHFSTASNAPGRIKQLERQGRALLCLFESCDDVRVFLRAGGNIKILNVGNMHYAEGKRQICQHVAASHDDMKCFDFLTDQGVRLDFRAVPGEESSIDGWPL